MEVFLFVDYKKPVLTDNGKFIDNDWPELVIKYKNYPNVKIEKKPVSSIFNYISTDPTYAVIFKDLIADPVKYPVIHEINNLFEKTALEIQNGQQAEFIHSTEWLNVYWPPEEYALIKLNIEGKLGSFYDESGKLITTNLQKHSSLNSKLVQECIKYNSSLIKIPFQNSDISLSLSYDIENFYQKVRLGKTEPLQKTNINLIIDRTSEKWSSWESWFREMVWYGNRRGAYLYGTKIQNTELAGHH